MLLEPVRLGNYTLLDSSLVFCCMQSESILTGTCSPSICHHECVQLCAGGRSTGLGARHSFQLFDLLLGVSQALVGNSSEGRTRPQFLIRTGVHSRTRHQGTRSLPVCWAARVSYPLDSVQGATLTACSPRRWHSAQRAPLKALLLGVSGVAVSSWRRGWPA